MRNASAGSDIVASYTGGPYSNVAISVQMQIVGGEGTTTIGARWGAYASGVPTAGYAAELSDSGLAILWRVNDWTQLDTYSIPGFQAGQWVTLTLRANGSSLSVEVNGVTRLTATDSTFTSGDVGLWSYQSSSAGQHRFDNFVVQVLGSASLSSRRGLAASLRSGQTTPNLVTRLFDWLRSFLPDGNRPPAPAPVRAVNAHPPVGVPRIVQAAPLAAPPTGQTWRSYYYAGTLRTRVAMCVEGDPDPAKNGVYYLHADHPSLRSGQASAAPP